MPQPCVYVRSLHDTSFAFTTKIRKWKQHRFHHHRLIATILFMFFSGYSIINGSLYRIHPTWQLQYTFSLFSRFMTHGLTFSLFFALPLFFSLSLSFSLSLTHVEFSFFLDWYEKTSRHGQKVLVVRGTKFKGQWECIFFWFRFRFFLQSNILIVKRRGYDNFF